MPDERSDISLTTDPKFLQCKTLDLEARLIGKSGDSPKNAPITIAIKHRGRLAVADNFDGAGLLDSAAHATLWEELLFVPAALWTPDGWSNGIPPEPLEEYTTAYLPTGVQPDGDNLLEWSNALWVRARLPVALGVAPPTCRHSVRWQFLDIGLLAVSCEDGEARVTPFACTDCELQAELRFGRGCPANRRRAVAVAFWGLLVSAPAALANYRDRFMFNDGHDISPTLVGYWRGLFHFGGSQR
jgi:hypothetical protein